MKFTSSLLPLLLATLTTAQIGGDPPNFTCPSGLTGGCCLSFNTAGVGQSYAPGGPTITAPGLPGFVCVFRTGELKACCLTGGNTPTGCTAAPPNPGSPTITRTEVPSVPTVTITRIS
ncbi:hypothetical protein DL98DRAFT_535510 [Cadophora sp. DSE1049]|nr:hypothetical protein DL98DRAFT_535510 [Cadophora sp. DSE1049]